MSSAPPKKPQDHIVRGIHGYHWSRTLFAFLRPLDPVCCYALLHYYGLSSSPSHRLLISLISISSLRQSFWSLYLHPHPLTVPLVIQVVIYNHVLDLIWTLVSCYALPPGKLGTLQYVALGIHLVGAFIETFSEIQRKRFKEDPRNEGKLHMTGLFSIAQHINYTGYIFWRLSLGLATGSVIATLLSLHNLADFYSRGVPALQEYLTKRYGTQKAVYDKQTPWKLIPYVW